MLKKLLIALVPLGTIAVVVWLVLPAFRALGEAKAIRADAQKVYQDKQELVAKIRNLEEQYAQVGDTTTKVAQIIPQTPDIPNLLAEIPELALQHGLTMNNIGFSVREGEVGQLVPAGQSFRTLDANIDLTGSFEAFKIFLKALEKELRIMDVQSLRFVVPRQGEGRAPYIFSLKVRMYYGLET